jgi:hypothetical protein
MLVPTPKSMKSQQKEAERGIKGHGRKADK